MTGTPPDRSSGASSELLGDTTVESTIDATGEGSAVAFHPGALITAGSLSAPVGGEWNRISVPAGAIRSGRTYWLTFLGRGGALSFRVRAGDPMGAYGPGPVTPGGPS